MTVDPLELLVSPAFVERAVIDAPFIAFVPISILIDPVDTDILERFPRAMTPEPEIVILSVGRTRAVTMIPLIVPLALDPTKVWFQLIGAVRAPLPTTVPEPMVEAEVREIFAVKARSIAHTRARRSENIKEILEIDYSLSMSYPTFLVQKSIKKTLQMSRVFIFIFSGI